MQGGPIAYLPKKIRYLPGFEVVYDKHLRDVNFILVYVCVSVFRPFSVNTTIHRITLYSIIFSLKNINAGVQRRTSPGLLCLPI